MTASMSGRVAVDVPLGKGTETATRPTRRCEWWQGCDDPARSKGLCQRHYRRMWGAFRLTSRRCTTYSSVFGEVDEVVVARLVQGGYTGPYTSFERREAVRRLVAAGMPKRAVARHLALSSDRQVYRDLAHFNAASPSGFPVEQEAAG